MRNFDTIQSCEQHFCNWIKVRLNEYGISANYHLNLTDLLHQHENQLEVLEQHIKPLKRWSKIKDECYAMTGDLSDVAIADQTRINDLMEKIAFEGQILLLTMQAKYLP